MKQLLALGIFICVALCGQIAHADKVFNAEHYVLDNGLQVVVIPNHRVPVVTHMVWYRAGAADEPDGKSGIAHFMEHLMFKGSENLKPGEFSEIVRSLGGNDNAFTSQDYTAYFQSIAVEHLETVMRMEAGRMRGMNPPPEQVASELKVILEERSQRTDNNPSSLMNEQLSEALHADHPYGDPVIGWRDEMESLTWEDAKTFYDQYYAPNNAILIVSGDVTGEQVLDLANEIYGPLEPQDVPARSYIKDFNKDVKRSHINYQDPRVRQPAVNIAYRVPSYRQNPAESLALEVLQEIVGEGSSSRLYKSLVIEQKLASGTGLSYRSNVWDDSELWAYASPLPGVELDAVKDALTIELHKIANEGVSDAELSDAITRMENQAIFARDSVSGPAMIIGYSLITGSKIDDVESWPENVASVTKEQIQAVAAKYLKQDSPNFINSVSGYLMPASAEQPQDGGTE